MEKNFTEDFARSLLRFKTIGKSFHNELDLHFGELMLMREIAENSADMGHAVCMSDIQSNLFITKPAVSQMLNSLERKDYIRREINTSDRRRIVVTLTPKGFEIMRGMQEQADRVIKEVISRFGEEDTKQLLGLLNRFADIFGELKSDSGFPGKN